MKPVIRSLIFIGMVALAALAILDMTGCAPRQFVLGAETQPPAGCVAARERGHEC